MASVSLSSTLPSPSFSCLHRQFTANLLSPQFNALAPTCGRQFQCGRRLSVAQTFDFSASFFESGLAGQEEDDDDSNLPPGSGGLALAVEEGKTEIQCPPGLRKYETMAVIRSDMTEDERLTLTQKYEEIAVHGLPVDNFSRCASRGVNLCCLSMCLDLSEPASYHCSSRTNVKFEVGPYKR